MRIAFARRAALGSWLIRLFTFSRWSHCAIVEGDTVVDATFWHGVRRSPLSDFLAHYEVEMVDIELGPFGEYAGMWLEMQIGKKYDWAALVALPLRRKWSDPDKWFCSELVAATLWAGGRPVFREDISRIVPQHLWMLQWT